MNAREQRGKAIAETQTLVQKSADTWVVPSQSGNGKYHVFMNKMTGARCTCPDHVDNHYV